MKNKVNVKFLVKSLGLSFCITIIMIFITSLLLQFTSLRESKMMFINNIIMIVSVFVPSVYLSLKVKAKGWLNGLLLGLSYYLVVVLLNLIFFKGDIIISFIVGKLLLIGLIGSIGGIIGINLT